LLGLEDYNELAGHPVVGASWEGFVIENLVGAAPDRTLASFYRTSAGAEIDLLLELPGKHGMWAIEVKRSAAARAERGFHNALADLEPSRSFVVYAGNEEYKIAKDVEAIGVRGLTEILARL
jgi:hypothetical protein